MKRERWSHRTQLLSSTAHTTLLRVPPFRLWSLDPKQTLANQMRDAESRQTIILVSGVALGLVIKTENGFEARP
jgi:hypothetical protein